MGVMSMLPYHVFERSKDHDVELVTVWDGTGRGASGTRYLEAVEEPTRKTSGAVLDFRSFTDRVLDTLARGPRTARQLANELGGSIGNTSGTLYALRQRGLVRIQGGNPVDPRVGFGRKSEHVYALAGGQ